MGAGFLTFIIKWGPSLVLISLSFYAGFSYKTYLVNSAALASKTEALNHYEVTHKEYVDTVGDIQLEYESKIMELDNDTSIDCNNVAPQCLRDAFQL